METKLKIQALWSYLEVQADEVLIVKVYDNASDKDKLIVAETKEGELSLSTADSISTAISGKSFRLIQQRDVAGKYIIPSVQQLIENKKLDY